MSFDPRLAGLDPAEDDGLVRAIKIRSMPSFGEEVKTSAPFRNSLRHVKEPFEELKRNFVRQNLLFLSPISPALLLNDCW
jgi:hypothetical protein